MARKTKSDAYPSPPTTAERDRWQVRDALQTLTRAEEIKADKALMREVKAEAKTQIKTVGRVLAKPKSGRTPT